LIVKSVPRDKIIVGKPLQTNDASSGWVTAYELSSWFDQAFVDVAGWHTGFSIFQWDNQRTSTDTAGTLKTASAIAYRYDFRASANGFPF
jgi:hypothetical protein